MKRVAPTPGERFWPKVDTSAGPGACWPWMAYRSSRGYGAFRARGDRNVGAHRFAWFLTHGAMPADGLFVCHHCDNPPCCNPAHLFVGTNADNVRDRDAKNRQARQYGEANGSTRHPERRPRGDSHWMRLHPERIPSKAGEKNNNAKLTEDDVRSIRALDAELPRGQIAARFGVTVETVRRIVVRRRWGHVK